MEIPENAVLVRPYAGSGMRILHDDDTATTGLQEAFDLSGTLALLDMVYRAPADDGSFGPDKSDTYLMEPQDVGALMGMLDEIRVSYSEQDHAQAQRGYTRSRRACPEGCTCGGGGGAAIPKTLDAAVRQLKKAHPELAELVDTMVQTSQTLKAKLRAAHETAPHEDGPDPADRDTADGPDVETMTPEEFIATIAAGMRTDQ